MLRDEIVTRLGEVDAELTKLGSYTHPTNGQVERTKELVDEAESLRDQILDCDRRQAKIWDAHKKNVAEGRSVKGASFEHWRQTPNHEVFEARGGDTDANLRAIDIALEDATRLTGRSVDVVPAVRPIIERNTSVGDYLRAAADPNYRTAWAKLVAAGDASAALLHMTEAERQAFTTLAEVEQRTPLFSGATTGSYAVPIALDQSIIPSSSGSANPFRQIARQVTGIAKEWKGVSSAGITASWDSEGIEVDDNSPTLAQPSVVSHKAAAFVEFSVEIEGDWEGMAGEMAMLFADAKDDLEAVAFATGNGTDKPFGVLTDLFAASGTVGVLPTTDGQFGAVDVRAVFGALGPRYRPNSSWLASIDVQNEIRSMGDDKLGNQTVDLTQPYNFALLGRPVYEASGFPDFVGTTGAANILVVGDFRNYVVFDRLGSRVELVPHLLGSNRLPNGLRGLYYWWRVGGKTVNSNAFRILLNA